MFYVTTPEHETVIQSIGELNVNDNIRIYSLLNTYGLGEDNLQCVSHLWQQSPEEGLTLVGVFNRMSLVWQNSRLKGGRWVLVRIVQWHLAKLLVL